MKKFKFFVFILLIIFLIIVFFYGIFGTGLSYLSSKDIKKNREVNKDLIKNLKINNKETIYDNNNDIYYYTISEKYQNQIYILKLELEDNLNYKIVGETLNIIKVNYNKPINIIIYNKKYYCEIKLQLTNLPLVNIEVENDITSNDSNSVFTYINYNDMQKFTNNSKIHIRGATSTKLPKKSYKIIFTNKDYTDDKNVYISNFYYGDSLILDALYRDPSKIRNVMSIDIWNDISNDFNNIDINSEFVELFINNEYKGLYVLTEPINRKKLKLEKSNDVNTSLIIKTNGPRTVGTNTDFNDIRNKTYIDYEIKYPNDEELYNNSWKTFLNLISDYFNPNVKTTDKVIKNTFNNQNYLDIIIFNSFVTNMDSCLLRNSYFYMKSLDDNEVYTQPWDLEFTYGHYLDNRFDEQIKSDKIYCEFYHENAKETNRLLIDRYWQLRKDILTKKYFDNILNKYKNQLNKGAALRDSELWGEYDLEKEIEKIRTWLYERLEFFDNYVKGLENE